MSDYLTLSQAAKTLPGRPHLSTLHRWRQRGVRGIKLQTALVGGRRYTTRAWLDEFIDAITAAADGDARAVRSSRRRERDIAAAERELEEAGI